MQRLADPAGVVKSERTRIESDLWIARQLICAGVPLVLAFDRGNGAFTLEKQWQKAEPSEETLWKWLNGYGDMLAAVCGHV